MAKRDELKARADRAAQAGVGVALDQRFAHAETLLKDRPTGFHPTLVTPPDAEPEGEGAAAALNRTSVVTERGVYHAIVPITDIDENPFNARRIYRQERIEKLAVSIANQGQIVPGIATIRNGRHVLAAGHYRLRSIKFSGGAVMEVMVHPDLTDQQLYEMSLKENSERDDQSAYDNALVWRDLLDKKVYPSEDALATAIGFSPATINKTLATLHLSVGVLEVVKQNPGAFGMSVLYVMAQLEKVAGATVTHEVAEGVLAEKYSRADIERLRERYAQPKTRKPRETTRHNLRIKVGDTDIGSLRDFGDGRVLLNVTMEDSQARTELLDLLKGHFHIN